jgi:P-type Cu+ transporter
MLPHEHQEAASETGRPRDPVCGTPARDDWLRIVERNGVAYRFCSDDCVARFRIDPARYTGNRADPGAKPTNSTIEHACSMHPDAQQPGAAACPKCRITLEARSTDADVGKTAGLRYMFRGFWIAAVFAVPFVFVAMGDLLPGRPVSALLSTRERTLLELALATPICLWAVWPFYVRFVHSLKNRGTNI